VTVHRSHSEGKEPTRCDKVCSLIASTRFGHLPNTPPHFPSAPPTPTKLTQHTQKLPQILSNPTHPVSTQHTNSPYKHTTNDPRPRAVTSLTNSLLTKPPHCSTLQHNTRPHYFAYLFQVWPPKSGSYLLTLFVPN
jgi:hypothetical protein